MSEKMIPHSRPTFDQEDMQAVLTVLKSGQLVQGVQVQAFEEEVSSYLGVKGAAAVSSGTAALHLALVALGVGERDEVIIPSYVCTALLNAIHYVRATPVIADIEGDTFNISVSDVKRRLTKRTKAVIVPHMFGLPADLSEMASLGVPLIEDCAQSIGSRYRDARTGGLGILSVFSFYATKMIASGEGGMILSNQADLIERIKDLRGYDEKEDYQVRYNYRMTDLQAALGRSQLRRLDLFIRRRQEIAKQFNRTLSQAGVQIPVTTPGREHVYYRYVILLDRSEDFMRRMRDRGIDCRKPVFKPLHEYLSLPGYAVTRHIWQRAASIPLYPALTEHDVADIIGKIRISHLRDDANV
jgi:perosamine synthetase